MEVVGGLVMFRVYGAGKGRTTSGLFEMHMAARVAILVWYMEQNGADLYINEGFRPTGVRSDADVPLPFMTSAGISTQWFQVGRMWRGETPSAIVPNDSGSNLSKHRTGEALDSNAPTLRDFMLRAQGAYLAGLVFNVATESWHCEPLATPKTDLGPWVATVQGVVTPTRPATPQHRPLEATMFVLFEETDGQKRILAFSGGAVHVLSTNTVALIQRVNKQAGLPTEVIKAGQYEIAELSELARKANGTYIVRDLLIRIAVRLGEKLGVKLTD